MKRIFLIGLMALALLSCKKEEPQLQACFDINTDKALIGEVITFTDCSEEAAQIEWTFGDGEDTRVRSPQHVYETRGEYEVTQTVYNDLNEQKVLSQTVTVGELIIDSVEIFMPQQPPFPHLMVMGTEGNQDIYFRPIHFNSNEPDEYHIEYKNGRYIGTDPEAKSLDLLERYRIDVYHHQARVTAFVPVYNEFDKETMTLDIIENNVTITLHFSHAE